MKLVGCNGDVLLFKSKIFLNIMLFIFFMFLLVVGAEILEFSYNTQYILLYVILCAAISGTFRRVIVFEKGEGKIISYRTVLGFKLIKKHRFIDINEILVQTEMSPIVGVQLPLAIPKHSVQILFKNGGRLRIDRSSDAEIIRRYEKVISKITSQSRNPENSGNMLQNSRETMLN